MVDAQTAHLIAALLYYVVSAVLGTFGVQRKFPQVRDWVEQSLQLDRRKFESRLIALGMSAAVTGLFLAALVALRVLTPDQALGLFVGAALTAFTASQLRDARVKDAPPAVVVNIGHVGDEITAGDITGDGTAIGGGASADVREPGK